MDKQIDIISNTGFIIIAGGKGKRIGQRKDALKWGNATFIEYIADKAKHLGFGNIYISSNEDIAGYEIIRDIKKDIGPIEGVYRCLKVSAYEKNFVISVDVPQAPESLIRDMVIRAYDLNETSLFLSYDKYIEPLFAVYDKAALPYIKKMIDCGGYSVKKVADKTTSVKYNYDGDLDDIKSINTNEEYEKFKIKYEK